MPLQEVRLTLRLKQAEKLLPKLLDRCPDVLDGGRDGWISCGSDLHDVKMKTKPLVIIVACLFLAIGAVAGKDKGDKEHGHGHPNDYGSPHGHHHP